MASMGSNGAMILALVVALVLVAFSGGVGFLSGKRYRAVRTGTSLWLPIGIVGACLAWMGLFLDWFEMGSVSVMGLSTFLRVADLAVPNWLLLIGIGLIVLVNALPALRRSRILFPLAILSAAYGIVHCALFTYGILRVADAPVGWGPFVTGAGFMILLGLSCANLAREP
jgi:hypothetical protein